MLRCVDGVGVTSLTSAYIRLSSTTGGLVLGLYNDIEIDDQYQEGMVSAGFLSPALKIPLVEESFLKAP